MKRSTLMRRVRAIEQARGVGGAVTLSYRDGTIQNFVLARQVDEMKILFAAVAIARAANVPDAPPPMDDRFTRIAREVGRSEGSNDEDLYGTVRDLVRGAEELERKHEAF